MAKQPRKKKLYKMPEPLPLGEILTDTAKVQWEIGPSIGKGGFGEIYSAKKVISERSNVTYVIKIEPHDNGPLFVEMHFYMRNCKEDDVDAHMQSKKLKTIGVPYYYGSGSHIHNGEKYRFIVIEKFGTDVWKLFLNNKKLFPLETVLKLGIQILDILEYIHGRGYIHADIKGANLLLGSRTDNQFQVYLLDYGLAGRYFAGKTFKPDPKKAHNGTPEYLSVDAHDGVQTRRGDLEILLYNLIQWLGCKLPWEDNLKDIKYVHQCKRKNLEDVPEFLKICFGSSKPPSFLIQYLKYLNTLKFDSEPDYDKLKNILLKDLTTKDLKLKFNTARKRKTNSPTRAKKVTRLSRSMDRVKPPNKVQTAVKLRVKRNKTKIENGNLSNNDEDEDNDIENNGDVEINGGNVPSMIPAKNIKVKMLKLKSKRLSMSMDSLNNIKKKATRTRGKKTIDENGGETLTAEMLKYKKQLEDKKLKNHKATKTETTIEDVSDKPSTSGIVTRGRRAK